MMRNVAIGALLGFGLLVFFLSVAGVDPPAPTPVRLPDLSDSGVATQIQPLNVAPVVVKPALEVQRARPLDPAALERFRGRAELMAPLGTDGGSP